MSSTAVRFLAAGVLALSGLVGCNAPPTVGAQEADGGKRPVTPVAVHSLVGMTITDARKDDNFQKDPKLVLRVFVCDGSGNVVLIDPANANQSQKIKGQLPPAGTSLDAGGTVGVVVDGTSFVTVAKTTSTTGQVTVPPLVNRTVQYANTHPPFSNQDLYLEVIFVDQYGNLVVTPPDLLNSGKMILFQLPAANSSMDAGGTVGVVVDGTGLGMLHKKER